MVMQAAIGNNLIRLIFHRPMYIANKGRIMDKVGQIKCYNMMIKMNSHLIKIVLVRSSNNTTK